MKVFILDNYDSFTYNLYQFVGELLTARQRAGLLQDTDIIVKRNDEVSLEQVQQLQPDRIIISPGPGSPDNVNYFGIASQVIQVMGKNTPLLGVCLGMQGIVHVFGGRVVNAQQPMHGKISCITHNAQGIFAGLPDQIDVMRYHSLIVDANSLPNCLHVTATIAGAAAGPREIMGVQHRDYPVYGIQFHPESFATECGKEMIANFLFV